MIRVIVYALLLAAISNACTTINIINSRLSQLMYVDSAFEKHVLQFVTEAGNRKVSVINVRALTMMFGKTNTSDDPGTVGTCSMINNLPVVIIDRPFWDVATQAERELLVFHELGHCILLRDHCEVRADNGPASIMVAELIDGVYYQQNRKKLVDELFHPTDISCAPDRDLFSAPSIVK